MLGLSQIAGEATTPLKMNHFESTKSAANQRMETALAGQDANNSRNPCVFVVIPPLKLTSHVFVGKI